MLIDIKSYIVYLRFILIEKHQFFSDINDIRPNSLYHNALSVYLFS